MNKVEKAIAFWEEKLSIANTACQDAIMHGASRKDVSAMHSYMKIIEKFIATLKGLA